MKKRIVSVLLIAAMVISLIPSTILGVFAANTSQPIISVENVWAAAGSMVVVNVEIAGNPGIYGATLTISWAEGLTLTAAESGEVFNGLSYQEPSRYVSTGTNFIWFGTRLREIKDGTVLKLTFAVAEGVSDVEKLAVNVTGSGLTDADNNIISASFESGGVQIVNYIPGDTDENGEIDTRDLTALAKYISDNCTTDPEGFNITINTSAADVDDDGELLPKDLVLIAKYISDNCTTDPEGFNVILKPATPRCTHADLQKVSCEPATCTEQGVREHWNCTACGKYYADAEAESEITCADTVVEATGHLNVTATPEKEATYEEDGNIAYWYCGDCQQYFSDEACESAITCNDTVIPAKNKYSITYYLYDNNDYLEETGVENPNPAWYDPDIGCVLENPAKPGFVFDGWYDAEGASGEIVKEIKAGEKGDKKLYARWSLVSYAISYKDDVYNVNYDDDTYTVDKRKVLTLPAQKGLVFVGWDDGKGNVYRELPKGMTGNLELNAKWKSHLYTAVPCDDQKVVEPFHYDAGKKVYYFVYSLGTLEGIPLEDLIADVNVFKHTGAGSTTFSWSESVTVEESKAESIGKSISVSASKSDEWSVSVEDAKDVSNEEHFDVTAGVELDLWALKVKLEGTYGASHTTTDSYSKIDVEGGSTETGSEESNESSVSLSYLSSMSTTVGTDIDISADSPVGYYTYAKLGNAKVYGIVAFNAVTGNYSLSTYSILEYAYDTHLYFPTKASLEESVNNPDIEALPFDVPIAEIAAYVKECCYVNYDGNGGQYSYTLADETMEDGYPVIVNGMPLSAFTVEAGGTLSPNLYTRTGYKFVGWALTKDGQAVYEDCDHITVEPADKAKVMTLYAVWEPVVYDITYHTNGGILPEEYPAAYTVETLEGIELPVPQHDTYPEYNHLIGWYLDEACTKLYDEYKLGYLTAPQDIDLYAKWYTVYDSIDGTPESVSGKVIIDWCNETDTDLLNHTNRAVNNGGYNSLDITGNTEQIVFIGDPEKQYTNFMIRLCGFTEGQKLVIRFVDFNFVTNENTAIDLHEDGGVALTIDVIGACSIGTNYAGGIIIGRTDAAIENLTFTGSGTMSITAGNGTDGSAGNADGGDGGVAVYADMLMVNMYDTLTVNGGNGGNGLTGADGAPAGADGADGGNGGNGGAAIVGAVAVNTGTVEIYGGNGGIGGNGGKGKNGSALSGQCATEYKTSGSCKGANGGNGGRGGDGGNGGSGASAVITESGITAAGSAAVLIKSGAGGAGGAGGDGGDGGKGQDGGDGWSAVGYEDGHAGGNGGNGGVGGNGGNGGLSGEKLTNATASENAVITVSSGSTGNGGDGGDGGDGGAGGDGGNSSEQWTGSHRWGGNGGDGGDAAAGGNGGDGVVAGAGGLAGTLGAAGARGCSCVKNGTPGDSAEDGSCGTILEVASTDVYFAASDG